MSKDNTPNESPYEILGIQQTDNLAEIKQAYKVLALKFHPDKNPHGVDKFQEINKAYQILSNPETKLFFDSFGYEGLMFNQKFSSATDSNGSEWIISIAFCLISLVIDHFFKIYIEWIFVSLFILYFLIYSSSQLGFLFFIYIGGANILLYFVFPTKLIPFVTNFIIYGIVFLWPNITKKNSSITVTLWFFVMFFDSLRDIDISQNWLWRILSLNIIIFGTIILLLLGIYVLKKPETGPSFYSNIIALIFTSLNNSDLDISIYLIFWCPIWFLDYLSGRRIEWLIPPAFCVVQLILFQSSFIKIIVPLILSTTGVYYLIPSSIYQFLSNYIIHFLFHMVIYKANVALINNKDTLDQDQKSKLLVEKSVKQFITGFIFIFMQYFLNFSTSEWLFIGSLSLGYSLLIMAELYFFSFSIKSSTENAIQPYIPNMNNNTSSSSSSNAFDYQHLYQNNNSNSNDTQSTDKNVNNSNNSVNAKSSSSLIKVCQTCFHKNQNNKPLRKCSSCKMVYYCSKECQIKNWSFHKAICRPLTSAK
ncbi:hypothetical protein CYY_000537 [Polysphondylium violaceum]|uniref:J domain-containing protein n=1 Tax=Polysphondylium violaceum TaxID=133409 RepID=A0A8J4PZL5_9MYCE|nr:hypothetical protein CYY_000537 [Polysphondylium violaceum]